MIRRSRSERSARRAALILESGLGADVESLAHRNETELDEIRALTVDFNVRGMRAISRKPPKAVGTQMSREDIAVVEQMISLTPRAFGRPDWRWLPEEVIAFVDRQRLVTGINPSTIVEVLNRSRRPHHLPGKD